MMCLVFCVYRIECIITQKRIFFNLTGTPVDRGLAGFRQRFVRLEKPLEPSRVCVVTRVGVCWESPQGGETVHCLHVFCKVPGR